jgi:hypothetical protein
MEELDGAELRGDALSCSNVARRHPRDPRRRVMAQCGAFAGCRALRAPLMVSHMSGQTRRTTRVALPRHRSLRQTVPPAQSASPVSRSTPRLASFVKRVLQTSFSKGVCGDADVPQVPPLSCAGDRHGILPQQESPLGAAELSVFEAVRARWLCGKHGVRLRTGGLAHGSHHGRHRCQRHARPERLKPPGQPIHGGVSSSLVTRVGFACAGRCLAGEHGISPAHQRVCHRDHRPRLPTMCCEALRQRRAWRALRAAIVDQAQTGLVDGLPEGRQGRVVQGSVHREGEAAQVSGPLCLSDFSHLLYAPAQAKRAIIAARRGKGCPAPFPWPCGASTLEPRRDQRRGSPQVFHSTALWCAGSSLPEPHACRPVCPAWRHRRRLVCGAGG